MSRIHPSGQEGLDGERTCALCGKVCGTRQGLLVHLGKKHGVRHASAPPVPCAQCGKLHARKASRVQKHNFCGVACRTQWQSQHRRGENSPTGICVCARCKDGRGHRWLHSRSGTELLAAMEAEAVAEVTAVS